MNLLNKKNIIVLVSVLVVAGVGTFFYQQSCDQKEQAAKTALYQVEKIFQSEVTTLTEAEKATGTKLDVDAKFPKTVAELNQLLGGKMNSERVQFEAALKLGTLYLEYSKDDSLGKAIDALKKVSDFGTTKFQKASALFLLGTAQERANLAKDAADSFQKALNQDYEGLKGELMLSLVRVNLKANNPAQAKTFSDKLNKEAPGSRAAQEAQKLISSKT